MSINADTIKAMLQNANAIAAGNKSRLADETARIERWRKDAMAHIGVGAGPVPARRAIKIDIGFDCDGVELNAPDASLASIHASGVDAAALLKELADTIGTDQLRRLVGDLD